MRTPKKEKRVKRGEEENGHRKDGVALRNEDRTLELQPSDVNQSNLHQ
jgi:hypothetical protein